MTDEFCPSGSCKSTVNFSRKHAVRRMMDVVGPQGGWTRDCPVRLTARWRRRRVVLRNAAAAFRYLRSACTSARRESRGRRERWPSGRRRSWASGPPSGAPDRAASRPGPLHRVPDAGEMEQGPGCPTRSCAADSACGALVTGRWRRMAWRARDSRRRRGDSARPAEEGRLGPTLFGSEPLSPEVATQLPVVIARPAGTTSTTRLFGPLPVVIGSAPLNSVVLLLRIYHLQGRVTVGYASRAFGARHHPLQRVFRASGTSFRLRLAAAQGKGRTSGGGAEAGSEPRRLESNRLTGRRGTGQPRGHPDAENGSQGI